MGPLKFRVRHRFTSAAEFNVNDDDATGYRPNISAALGAFTS